MNNAADYVNNSIPYKVYNEKFTVNPKELKINLALRPTPILLIKNFRETHGHPVGFLVPILTGTAANNNIVLFNKNQYT